MGKRLIATIVIIVIILVAFILLIPGVFNSLDRDHVLSSESSVASEVAVC